MYVQIYVCSLCVCVHVCHLFMYNFLYTCPVNYEIKLIIFDLNKVILTIQKKKKIKLKTYKNYPIALYLFICKVSCFVCLFFVFAFGFFWGFFSTMEPSRLSWELFSHQRFECLTVAEMERIALTKTGNNGKLK